MRKQLSLFAMLFIVAAVGRAQSDADAAKVIQAYRTAKGGSGVMFMTITTITGKMNKQDTMQGWFTNGGDGRVVMGMPGGGNMVLIGRVSTPTYSVTLDEGKKNFVLNDIDTALINGTLSYSVEKLGNETVAGYPCTHVRVTSKMGRSTFSSTSTSELWLSTAVPGYSVLKNGMLAKGSQLGMMKALHQAGVDGFFVKMTSGRGKDYSMTMQLVQVKEGSFPASMFEIPAGYTLDKSEQ
jgi:hypothetical protein